MRKVFKRIIPLCICLLLLLSLLPNSQASAASMSLEIQFPQDGAVFRIYRVADYDGAGNYKLLSPFSGYGVQFGLEEEQLRSAASLYSSYARLNKVKPTAEGVISGGRVVFPIKNRGIYLVDGDSLKVGDAYYEPYAYFVAVPGEHGDRTPDYNPVSRAKYSHGEDTTETTEISVKKKWQNDTVYFTKRPKEATVQLLANGIVADTQKLNDANQWRYTWKNLGTKDEKGNPIRWTVVEKSVPARYIVQKTEEGGTIVLVNTMIRPPSDTPPSSPKLPQTGQLWWPVPVLMAAGLALVLLGILIRRRRSDG